MKDQKKIRNCPEGFHISLAQDLITNSKCSVCGRNYSEEDYVESCESFLAILEKMGKKY